jgi:hypothetical protein
MDSLLYMPNNNNNNNNYYVHSAYIGIGSESMKARIFLSVTLKRHGVLPIVEALFSIGNNIKYLASLCTLWLIIESME